MKKNASLLVILSILLMAVSIVSCQKSSGKEKVAIGDSMGKDKSTDANDVGQVEQPKDNMPQGSTQESDGDLSNVNKVEQDLNSDELNDLDAGLSEVESI